VFETVVRKRFPVVDEAIIWLSSQAKQSARMTGSGSCIFVAVDEEAQARAIVEHVPHAWQAFAAQGKNRSPLKAMLEGG
jgi:4-diphosphocytidyl-2-C-methyl-D-erythritol kinase